MFATEFRVIPASANASVLRRLWTPWVVIGKSSFCESSWNLLFWSDKCTLEEIYVVCLAVAGGAEMERERERERCGYGWRWKGLLYCVKDMWQPFQLFYSTSLIHSLMYFSSSLGIACFIYSYYYGIESKKDGVVAISCYTSAQSSSKSCSISFVPCLLLYALSVDLLCFSPFSTVFPTRSLSLDLIHPQSQWEKQRFSPYAKSYRLSLSHSLSDTVVWTSSVSEWTHIIGIYVA